MKPRFEEISTVFLQLFVAYRTLPLEFTLKLTVTLGIILLPYNHEPGG